ncbi:MAG: baseplate J/gp47 family protein [Laribacter sp.]|nr:baseplate J/gp47 family protein [Laribacter sp.]MBP9526913.1 baseplate J/gp47 family protein [Laribacter sp.]MBP9608452.1 baseplate J/gp47 family protein [Laribacter sp.]
MIDLSKLPPPDLLDTLDYEAIYQAKLERFKSLCPAWSAALESDPVVKLLELSAYDELLLRARINDAAKASLLAYATKEDLDNRAADYGVSRLLISPANPDASPPAEAVYEDDSRLRYRCQMAFEGLAAAGPAGAYVFHALSASPLVADVAVDSPQPGEVRVTILPADRSPASAGLLAVVSDYLSADERRPLSDTVRVQGAALTDFRIDATLMVYPGPSPAPVLESARAALDTYLASVSRIGHDVTLSGLYAALHQPGVERVQLNAPTADVTVDRTGAARCISIVLREGTADV